MAAFTNVDLVRQKFQLADETVVPTALVQAAIDDAHTVVLRYLAPEYEGGATPAGLVVGETELAGAHLLRSLASGDAFKQKHLSLGGQKIEEGKRFSALMTLAERAEEAAWAALDPFLEARPATVLGRVTDSTPVLGAASDA